MDDTRPQDLTDPAILKEIYRELLEGFSKHTILEVGSDRMYHTTKRKPWAVKEERRAKNKRAKAARKKNRK